MELRERDIVLIDTETTGFDKDKHQLLDVAMLIIRQGKVTNEFQIKIKHKEYIVSASAMQANKIDLIKHEDIGVTTKEAVQEILKFLGELKFQEEGFIVLGQNVQFDIGFLEKLFLKEYKIKEFRELVSYRTIDIMQLAMIRSLEGKIKLEKQNLDHLLEALGIEIPSSRHQAIADCWLEYFVYKKLLEL